MYDKKEFSQLIDFYEKDVTSNQDDRTRLNLDVILHYLLKDASSKEKNRAVTYAKKEMEKATVIMISHRITSLMQADCIIVMDKGEIQQMGTHEELIHQEGPYKDIYEIQMNSDIRLMEGGAACE